MKITNVAGPLTVSTENPRYFRNNLGHVMLFGHHTWYNPQDGGGTNPPPVFDFDDFLASLTSRGVNFTKLWSMETLRGWSDDTNQWYYPAQWERTGPGNANDGYLKVDLTQVNTEYLRRLVDRATACAANSIYVVIQFFQGWQNETNKGGTGDPVTYHPMLLANNINGVDGDQNDDGQLLEIHTDLNNNAWAYQQGFIEAVIDAVNHLDNILYEAANEDTGSANNTDWQYAVINHINTYQASKPKQHPVGMTIQYPNGDDAVLDASGADWVSYKPSKADAVHSASDPVSMYDTDHTIPFTTDLTYYWGAYCNGHGGVWMMDHWNSLLYVPDTRSDPTFEMVRDNLGYMAAWTRLIDLPNMIPAPALSTTGYCLAKDSGNGDAVYIVLRPSSGTFNLNLSTAVGTLNVEWLRCATGDTSTTTVAGGAVRTLTPPWTGVVMARVYN